MAGVWGSRAGAPKWLGWKRLRFSGCGQWRMGASQQISSNDLRTMLRLAGEAAELPADSDARRLHLLNGICRMLGSHAAMAFRIGPDPIGGPLAEEGAPVLVVGMTP